jgi:hypothetical protein
MTSFIPHAGYQHVLEDGAYFLVVGLLAEKIYGRSFLIVSLLGCQLLGECFYVLWDERYAFNVGSSAAVHGTLAAVLIAGCRGRHILAKAVMLGFVAHLIHTSLYACMTGTMAWPEDGPPNSGYDHLGGVVMGITLGILTALRNRRGTKPSSTQGMDQPAGEPVHDREGPPNIPARWPIRVLSSFALVLCVLASVLWIRGYLVSSERVSLAIRRGDVDLLTDHAQIVVLYAISHRHARPSSPLRFDYERLSDDAVPIGILKHWGGLGFYVIADDDGLGDIRGVAFPSWFLPLLAAMPCILLFRAIRRRAFRQVGRCAVCGYDLRATPGRCPECGTNVIR